MALPLKVLKSLTKAKEVETGASSSAEIEFEYYYISKDQAEHKSFTNVHEIASKGPEWATITWLNIEGINEAVVKALCTQFNLHPLAVEDMVEHQNRPKVDFYGDMIYLLTTIITKSHRGRTTTLETEQVSFFFFGNLLITVQQGLPGDVWTEVRQQIETANSAVRNSDAGYLLYELLSKIVDTCEPIIEELNDILEDMEPIMLEKPSTSLNRSVYSVKRHQMTLRTVLLPTKRAISRMIARDDTAKDMSMTSSRNMLAKQEQPPLLSASAKTYFADLNTDLTHLCDALDQQRELASSLNALYSEYQAQKQGDASYAIALVSVFFLPLTFVAGVYGMNFTYMPELQWHYGYLYVWMIFIGLVIVTLAVALKAGWIKIKFRCGMGRNRVPVSSKKYSKSSLIKEDDE